MFNVDSCSTPPGGYTNGERLLASGVQSGSTLVTLMPNRIERAILLVASTILPLTLASLDHGALAPARRDELQNYVETLRPEVIVVTSKSDIPAVDEALAGSDTDCPTKMILDPCTDTNTDGWDALLDVALKTSESSPKESDLIEQAREQQPEHIALVLFTSGTSSGKPKGCPRNAESTAYVLESQKSVFRFEIISRYLHVTPNFRVVAPALAMAIWKF